MKVLINPGKSRNVIATLAIGDKYYDSWEKYALPGWEEYCDRHDLGLVVCDTELLSRESSTWKKVNWQKLLIGEALKRERPDVNNVCYIDTDILINYTAPNVFDSYIPGTIGLVSQYKNLPYPREQVLRRIAFFRHNYYDRKYPLDSALFISLERYYEFHKLKPQADQACSGFFVFNLQEHADLLSSWFHKYDRNLESITGGGDEAHINFEVQNWGKVSWLDYKFQAIWIYEMAWKYPFLYTSGRDNKELIRECVEASLFTNYFLHFAGSWYESEMWKVGGILESAGEKKKFEEFCAYEKVPVTGNPVGVIRPK